MSAITIFDRADAPRQMVKDLQPVLTERGKIKIGAKGATRKSSGGAEYQPPVKLNHFLITTLERGKDGNFVRDEELHRELGDKPTSIPVRLIFDRIDLNFQTRYVAFNGRTIWCQGDGETAIRDGRERPCPCPNRERGYKANERNGPVCKINGRLQVMIDGAGSVGGVWVLRTTSWNTVQGLASSMALIANVTGGRLSGVPLSLTVTPKQATDPNGSQVTVYVVGIVYRGSIDELRERAYQAALQDAQQGERLAHALEDARRMIAAPVVAPDEETDIRAEFYPEEDRRAREPLPERNAAPEEDEPFPGTPSIDDFFLLYGLDGAEAQVSTADGYRWLAKEMETATAEELQGLIDNNPDEEWLVRKVQEVIDARAGRAPPERYQIADADGGFFAEVGTVGEALTEYGASKKHTPDRVREVVERNLPMLRALISSGKLTAKLIERVQAEIDAAEMTTEEPA